MRKIAAFLLSCALVIGFLTLPAEAYGTGKVGEYQTICMGNLHTAAIKTDGSLWTWGYNGTGALGNGSDVDSDEPVKILDDVVSVSCGSYHTAAIKADGSLWVWGNNEYGQVGSSNSTTNYGYSRPIQTTPAKILDNVAAVGCGERCTAAIKTDGSLWMWGDSFDSAPIKVMDDVVAVSCGSVYGVVKKDGTLWVWGSIDEWFYGNVSSGYLDYKNSWKLDSNVASVGFFGRGVYYLKNDGTVWTWSEDVLMKETPPRQVEGLSSVVSVSSSGGHAAVILADNSLWMWGGNSRGELGIGSREGQTVPVKIMDQVASVFCGNDTTAVIKTDGTLWTWGDNPGGMLGYQDADMRYTINDPGGSGTGIKTTPKQVENFAIKPSTGAGAVQPSAPAVPTVAGFTDVAADAYYAAPVTWAVEKNITTGAAPDAFAPGNTCTNAQILTFLWRAYGQPEPTISNPFTNSIPEAYTKAAVWAYEKGMISGKVFDTDSPCTRAMAVTYMWQAAGHPIPAAPAESFTDVSAGASYALAVAWALEEGITSGTSAASFSPDEICNRGQIVTFLYRNLE